MLDKKKIKEKLEDEFDSFKQKNEPRWIEVREHLEKAIGELRAAAEVAFKKMKD